MTGERSNGSVLSSNSTLMQMYGAGGGGASSLGGKSSLGRMGGGMSSLGGGMMMSSLGSFNGTKMSFGEDFKFKDKVVQQIMEKKLA